MGTHEGDVKSATDSKKARASTSSSSSSEESTEESSADAPTQEQSKEPAAALAEAVRVKALLDMFDYTQMQHLQPWAKQLDKAKTDAKTTEAQATKKQVGLPPTFCFQKPLLAPLGLGPRDSGWI